MPPAPHAIDVLTQWQPAVVPIVVALALLAAYGVGVRRVRARGDHWPTRRTALFGALGVGSYGVVTLGFLGVYSPYLRWTFTAQAALLLLVVPALIALGQPIELARKALSDNGVARLNRTIRSWPARMLSHPVV